MRILEFLCVSVCSFSYVKGIPVEVNIRFEEARVLVTGFEPFNGYDYNPSGDVAKNLDGTCMNYTHLENNIVINTHTCFDGWVLPVDETGSNTVSNILLSGEPFPYDAILHLGLEDVAKGLKIETFAINQLAEYEKHSHIDPVTLCLSNSDYDQPTGPAAVRLAQCELPTTANLGLLSLEEAFLFAMDSRCRSMPEKKSSELMSLISSCRGDNGQRTTDAAMAHKSAPVKEKLQSCLMEAWSRNAGMISFCPRTILFMCRLTL